MTTFHPTYPCVQRGRWIAPKRYVKAGFAPKSVNLNHLDAEAQSQEAIRLTKVMTDWFQSTGYDHGTLGWIIEKYLTDDMSPFHATAPKTQDGYKNQCARWKSHAGDQKLPDIKFPTIHRWHAHFSDGGRMSNGHHMMTMLRIVMSYGVMIEDGECDRIDRVLGKCRFPRPAPRSIAPTREDVEKVIAAAEGPVKLGLQLQWDLALRPGDVRKINWGQVDLAVTRISGDTSKTKAPFYFPLEDAPVLRAAIIASERTTGRLVPLSGNQYRRAFSDALRKSGVTPFQARDIRAGAITEAEELGVPLDARRQFATHRSTRTTEIYSRGAAKGVVLTMKTRNAT